MAFLTKAQILAADDIPTEDVYVPEWKGTVRVRGLTAHERDNVEIGLALARQDGREVDIRAAYAGRCMIDENGKRLFTDKELVALSRKSGAALDRVFDVVRQLSGMTDEAVDKAAENFGETPDGDSRSA